MRLLLLGGTSEASLAARRVAEAGIDAVFSYAGRTAAPLAQPLPVRVGGFGGVAGLVSYLRRERITHVLDATHPFAAQMSRNARAACSEAGVALAGFERAPWRAGPGDRWTEVPSLEAAAAALPQQPTRVFLAIGRQHLGLFAGLSHHWLVRLVDDDPVPLAAEVVIDRGPFTLQGDRELLERHRIELIVAKNSGGTGARAKLDAARELGIPVLMVARPDLPERLVFAEIDPVLRWLHGADLGV